MSKMVLEELKKSFKPEFLNRIDESIVFHPLSKEDLLSIVDIMIGDINTHIKEKGLEIKLTSKAKAFLAEKGYDPKLGARPLRRVIENLIEEPISEDLLRGKFVKGSLIKADLKGDAIFFTSVKNKA